MLAITDNVVFQSRNRKAFHVRCMERQAGQAIPWPFQSRNRDAFHFRAADQGWPAIEMHNRFQSRNRDAFHVRYHRYAETLRTLPFQSRNRDAFHFRRYPRARRWRVRGFNLAIERLFISGIRRKNRLRAVVIVSISQSRGFSFQV